MLLSAGLSLTQPGFKIYEEWLGGKGASENDASTPWEILATEAPEGTWAMTVEHEQRKSITWKRISRVAVDGTTKASSKMRLNWKLVDPEYPNEILAVFTGNLGLSHSGTLQINVHWGFKFDRMVAMTLICLMMEGKRPTNNGLVSSGWVIQNLGY